MPKFTEHWTTSFQKGRSTKHEYQSVQHIQPFDNIGMVFWNMMYAENWNFWSCRGKLGNGEHLSLEAYMYKEYNIYVLIIMQHKEHIKFYPENIST